MMNKSHQQGFTLIEMIVSLAIFSLVVTIAIGALLVVMTSSKRLQGEQSVMTNLSFALDAMTRELRTGTFYYCDYKANTSGTGNIFHLSFDLDSLGNNYADCPNSNPSANDNKLHGVAFIEGGDSITATDERILYYFDDNEKKLYRRVGNGAPESIVSDGIVIKRAQFYVTGSQKLTVTSGNRVDQPAVTIFIEAAESNSATAESYFLETTVTQRTLDI